MRLRIVVMVLCCGALAACERGGEDDAASVEANAGVMADGMAGVDENAADTLGNQLNQLEETPGSSADNAAGNTAGNAENSD